MIDKLAYSDDIKYGLMNALQEQGKRSETCCFNCDNGFYDSDILERHHELYQ